MHWKDESGSSMLEFVLVLPFVFIIIVLSVDFSASLLTKQRTMVAAREVGFLHSRLAAAPQNKCKSLDEVMNTAKLTINNEILKQENLNGQFSFASSGSSEFNSQFSGGFDLPVISSLLGGVSKTQGYTVKVQNNPPVATLLKKITVEESFVVDGLPWTYYEMPDGYLGLALGNIPIIGDLFSECP